MTLSYKSNNSTRHSFAGTIADMNSSTNVHAIQMTGKHAGNRRAAPLTHYSERLLRLPDVIFLTGLGKTSIYSRCKEGTFPAPVDMGSRAVAWKETEVHAWIQGLQRTSSVE